MTSRLLVRAALLALLFGGAAALASDRPLELVDSVDLERYQGRWYEIARLPNRFQDQCKSDVSARYRLLGSGRVEVVNRCRRESGRFDEAMGEARRPDPERPAVLEVRFAPRWLSFLPWVWGDYQVMALDPEYRFVLVGEPSRQYLWVLARDPEMSDERLDALLDVARGQGFPVDEVERTQHTPGAGPNDTANTDQPNNGNGQS